MSRIDFPTGVRCCLLGYNRSTATIGVQQIRIEEHIGGLTE